MCAHSFARNWQLSFLNQRKRENDHRKYFMINLHERILPTSAEIEPATFWSPIGHASNWATEAVFFSNLGHYKCTKPQHGKMYLSFEYLRPAHTTQNMHADTSLHWKHISEGTSYHYHVVCVRGRWVGWLWVCASVRMCIRNYLQ